MTQTKKQKTVAERVAAENLYQRACAIWLADKLNKDPNKIYGVDFDMEYYEGCPTCGPDTYSGLEYMYNGKHMYGSDIFDLRRFNITPGRFLEECVVILKELEKNTP